MKLCESFYARKLKNCTRSCNGGFTLILIVLLLSSLFSYFALKKEVEEENEQETMSNTLSSMSVKAPIFYRTQSYGPISCYGNSVERTNKIAFRVRVSAWSYD